MQLRTVIRPALSSAAALCLLAGPAYAQEDDDAVEATQEELDAVGGLRGKEKAPTLESVDTAPTATETTSTTLPPAPTTALRMHRAPSTTMVLESIFDSGSAFRR